MSENRSTPQTRGKFRRDRGKDALLQEHGYLVLRFLAADLSRDLDATLNSILRALANRERTLQMAILPETADGLSAGISRR